MLRNRGAVFVLAYENANGLRTAAGLVRFPDASQFVRQRRQQRLQIRLAFRVGDRQNLDIVACLRLPVVLHHRLVRHPALRVEPALDRRGTFGRQNAARAKILWTEHRIDEITDVLLIAIRGAAVDDAAEVRVRKGRPLHHLLERRVIAATPGVDGLLEVPDRHYRPAVAAGRRLDQIAQTGPLQFARVLKLVQRPVIEFLVKPIFEILKRERPTRSALRRRDVREIGKRQLALSPGDPVVGVFDKSHEVQIRLGLLQLP